MGTEGNNIDDLFREKLGARESFPGPEGWMEAERLLNQKKKRRRGGFWIFWGLMLIAMSGLTFWYVDKYNPLSDVHTQESISEQITPQESLSSESTINERVGGENLEEMDANVSQDQVGGENSNRVNSFEQASTTFNATENPSEFKDIKTNKVSANTSGLEAPAKSSSSFSPSKEFDSTGGFEGGSKPMELLTVVNLYEPGYIDYLGQNGIDNELNLVEPEFFEPAFIAPPYITPIPKTSIEGAFDMAQTRSSFGNTQNPILLQRDEQEKPIFSTGFDLTFTHRSESLRYGLGLMYQNTGEDVQYSAEIEMDSITDNSYYEIIETYAEVIDSVFIDGQWVDDTLLVLIDTDSTFISDIDTSTFVLDDPTIGINNGRTSIQTISIPIQFGYEWQRRKSSWYFYGSVDPTWIIRRTATYLHSGSNTTRDITQIDTYRRMAWRASLGVAWNRELLENKAYLIVNPYTRFNLSSWNSSFDHKYMDLGLRIGVGLWIK